MRDGGGLQVRTRSQRTWERHRHHFSQLATAKEVKKPNIMTDSWTNKLTQRNRAPTRWKAEETQLLGEVKVKRWRVGDTSGGSRGSGGSNGSNGEREPSRRSLRGGGSEGGLGRDGGGAMTMEVMEEERSSFREMKVDRGCWSVEDPWRRLT